MQNGNNAIAIQENEGQLLMFHDPEENTDIQVKMLDETVWLTQEQMSILFHKATSTIKIITEDFSSAFYTIITYITTYINR